MAEGKKPKSKSKHKVVQIWKKYKIKDDRAVFQGRWCPRCGVGTALAIHSNRLTCGKCKYSEIFKK
ncbi:MAG: 30S ribosomal protein S27ae [Nitrososphaerota archaeon]|nr:30S ribosomal protein S27ae [Candidatus Aenigmarchaeota archaeon]